MANNTETKRISVNAIERAVEEANENLVTVVDWYGNELAIKRRLNIAEMMNFVDVVVSNCFTPDGEYVPETRDFTIRCATLEFYGNFRLPENLEKRYALVYSAPIEEALTEIDRHADGDQYDEILSVIYEKVKYIRNTNVEAANRKIEEMMKVIDGLGAQLNEVFGGMADEDVKALVENLAKGVDEGKLMDAYIRHQEELAAADAASSTDDVIKEDTDKE